LEALDIFCMEPILTEKGREQYTPELTRLALPHNWTAALDQHQHTTQEQRIALHCGLIDDELLQSLTTTAGVPQRLIAKLYRKLHLTILTHAYTRWIHRNENAKDIQRIANDNYRRKPKNTTKARGAQTPAPSRITARWHQARLEYLTRQQQWKQWFPPTVTHNDQTPNQTASADEDPSSQLREGRGECVGGCV
jgi:hypothetical protein